MNKLIKLVITLAIISGLSGFLLTYVNDITDPIIQKGLEEKEFSIVESLYPDVDHMQKNEINEDINYIIDVYNANDELLGYVYSVSGSNGYGDITTLLAIDVNDNITGIDFLEFSQTPGFGDKLLDEEYLNQFKNLDINAPYVDGVSGATFSSKLVQEEVQTITNYYLGGNNE